MLEAESTLGHSAADRIMSLKNLNESIGKGTRDLPACSAVSPPTAPVKKDVIAFTVLLSHFTAHNTIIAVCHWKPSFSPQSLS
jgi:hypothetical protein